MNYLTSKFSACKISLVFLISLLSSTSFSTSAHSQGLSAEEIQQQLSRPKTRSMRNLTVEKAPETITTTVAPNSEITPSKPVVEMPPAIPQTATTEISSSPLLNLTPTAQTTQPKLEEERIQVSLQIKFDFNSSKISSVSDLQVAALAKALKSKDLDHQRFMVEGHTDAKGKPDYNRRLSQDRADSVTSKLVLLGIERSRLSSIGLGSSRPLSGMSSFSDENRRVVIVAND
jgi:outer membrane protein OmpA-like peptidoglycan-associated protein